MPSSIPILRLSLKPSLRLAANHEAPSATLSSAFQVPVQRLVGAQELLEHSLATHMATSAQREESCSYPP